MYKAFTLLEILLVIAIMAVLGGLIIFTVRPAEILTDAKNTKVARVSSEVDDAVETYVIQNNGVYPFSTTNLAQTAYSICKQGQSSGCDINIDALVTGGYLSAIPTNDNESGNKSGYMLKYTSKGVDIGPAKVQCPSGYVSVPGNPLYQTADFCVMKYEAKNVGSVATSEAAGSPWASITQTAAISACNSLGSNYHLITNKDWMTISRNIEQVSSNWFGGTVGTNYLYAGHSDNGPTNALASDTNDSNGYFGTNDSTSSCDGAYTNFVVGDDTITGKACAGQRRTFTLSNDETIWDLTGNLWEWTDDALNCNLASCSSAEMPFDSTPATEYVELTNLVGYGQYSYDLIRPFNSSWNSTQAMGQIYSDIDAASPSGNVHAFHRGGAWFGVGSRGGIYSLAFNRAPAHSDIYIGFRCAYNL